MSTVTQRIPNFLLGISQQPDNRKFPGQVNDAVNTFPDYALGMLKRPGGKYISNLYGATSRGKWFSMLRSSNQKYVAQYDDTDFRFRVWSLTDGTPRRVDMGSNTGVPGSCNASNYQTDTEAYYNATALTKARRDLLNTAQATYAEALAGQDRVISGLWSVNNDYNLATGKVQEILIDGIYQQETNDTYTIVENKVVKYISANALSGPVITLQKDLVNNPGTGYSAANGLATTSTGTGTGLTVDITVTGGVPDQLITINNAGGGALSGGIPLANDGYKVGDVITITQGGSGGNAKYTVIKIQYELGLDKTAEHPILASQGYKLYEAKKSNDPAKTTGDLSTALSAMNTAQTNYTNAVTAEETAQNNYDAEITNCDISAIPSNGYLKDATAADIELLTLESTTFVLNKKMKPQMTASTVAALAHQAFVVINVVAYNANYKVTVDGTTKTHTTGQTVSAGVVDASTIVADLTSKIDSISGISATAVGPGIHIVKAASAMTISVSGGSQDDALYVFQDQVADVTRLPIQCADGYKLKIANSADFQADDMWVEFETTNNASIGPGTWIETNGPGITYELDPLTMPHKLSQQADGSFVFGPVTWSDRDVGDDVTNPLPSFLEGAGIEIRNMFFYRNRLGFLAGEYMILSKAKDFYNFFVGSATIAAADDPIDITASSTKPIFLNYVRNSAAGLVLFSENEQFLMSTDSDVLSPQTAKINAVSGYESDSSIEAVNLGTSVAFVAKSSLWTKLYELFEISTSTPPYMFDQTKIVPELIPATIDSMVASAGNGIVSLGQTGSSTVYQYRFYQLGEKRAASTWYKWDLTGTLLHQFFDVSTYYAIVADGSNVYIESVELTQASDTGFLTLPTGEKTDVCMDLYYVNPYRQYHKAGSPLSAIDVNADKTRIYLPFQHITSKKLAVVALGGYIGATDVGGVGAILYPTVAGSYVAGNLNSVQGGGQYVDIDGDYRGLNVIIGYIYEMKLNVPRIYPTQKEGEEGVKSDYTSNLIVHRVKIATGLSGPVTYNVNLTGIPDRSQTISVNKPHQYQLGNVNITADAIHDVPIYQRNENVSLSIIGDTPLPVSLLGMNWEGRYTDKFYSRG
mgnify:CR=1 FL=1